MLRRGFLNARDGLSNLCRPRDFRGSYEQLTLEREGEVIFHFISGNEIIGNQVFNRIDLPCRGGINLF